MSSLVVLRRCATLEEALVVKSLMDHGGFYCGLGEYYVATVQWDALAAFNGVSVWVPESQLFEAGQYLLDMRASAHERLSEEFGEIDTAPLKMRWGRAWTMLIIYSGYSYLLLIPIFFLLELLPIDWQALIDSSRRSANQSQVYVTDTQHTGLPKWNPEGLLFVTCIAVFLLFDLTDVRERKRLSQEPPEEL